jgi:hypothetical protein
VDGAQDRMGRVRPDSGKRSLKRRYDGVESPAVGLGATWEAVLTRSTLYEAQGRNEKFIPIVFDDTSTELLPKLLRQHTCYRVDADYEKLLRRLTAQAAVIAPKVGGVKILPPLSI